ncbi:HsdR family type I site-specific deoxyribonuclease [Salegentibacter sp. LM13S]|uniref:type I restriction endonuclease subunit R n=1 Tax=Salegentibacter lacus TaxID=2873599 RepID=UPI001CCAE07E|nr:HsdR family type I site-specific deoxyribonuclease [Salegentibacter lacus]MBZ9631612.1 HsdR family type I site-specific deoxyribonuclease [Salegentibacter lacus]
MDTPSFKEDHISQIPALKMLINLGYKYLSPEQALKYRAGKTSNVLLEDILRPQLKKINSIQVSSTRTSIFSDSNIENGILALKDISMAEGMISASEKIYNLLTLGKALEQNIDGDKKSFTLQFIDWKYPENNVYHVTEEFPVMRMGSKEHYRPDLVLFINGIPISVIECKRPDLKNPIKQAISQHLRNQQEDGIRGLYIYAQNLLSISSSSGRYATLGTPEKFWSHWEEKFKNEKDENRYNEQLYRLKNKALSKEDWSVIFGERYPYVAYYFRALEMDSVLPTQQDFYLYGLCSPERLLDFVFNFTLYDNGEKKIARYQQYFAIKKTIEQIKIVENGKRKGGVIWHTQGSGKSLTMVMLAEAIALEKSIKNPKIILVTDRTELDKQIAETFYKCGIPVEKAPTGAGLVNLLTSDNDTVITTIINKFDTAVKKIKEPLESQNIFVLVDEGHRTQHGTFNLEMQKTLPNACYIALTGTPLFKKDKNTLSKFGTLIDAYTVDQAVKDKAVVPLLYEGRHAFQKVSSSQMDNYFNLISEPLNDYEKADLKRKFSRADQLNIADQKVYAICWDISKHYEKNFQSTPFKGQLVTPSKKAAIRYKNYLDAIGIVSSEVVISGPDDREGEESAYGETPDEVKQFWRKMMDQHGSPKKYEENIVNRFKHNDEPEIIIVVDKLLTGFDAPRNIALYLTRNLKEHTLLQAIARVNRIYPDKDYGYIIDYYGVIDNLDEALATYSFEDFDEEDLKGTFTNIDEEIKKLPQKHSELWDLFKEVENKKDAEAYQQLLRDEAIRARFYNVLSHYARILKMALSSLHFHQNTADTIIEKYKEDLAFFIKLRKTVLQRFSDAVDYSQYEGQIQKLIDTHILTEKVEPITELVNIFNRDAFQDEVEKTLGEAAKADKIASRTSKHISEKMEEDPAFYKKFSEMLKETIREFEEHRLSEKEYLIKVKDLMNKVLSRTDSEIPQALKNEEVAKAFYGISVEELKDKIQDSEVLEVISVEIALKTDQIIKDLIVVDWHTNKPDIPKKMVFLIGDYLIDEIRDKYDLNLSFSEIDSFAEKMVEVAKIRYK